MSPQLSDMYDGDKARRDPVVARLRSELTIPHPLYEVRYADGVLRDTTAGGVRSQGRRATYRAKHQPCACGCGEMADECMTGRNPWGAFTWSKP